jgi:hypothetical protein
VTPTLPHPSCRYPLASASGCCLYSGGASPGDPGRLCSPCASALAGVAPVRVEALGAWQAVEELSGLFTVLVDVDVPAGSLLVVRATGLGVTVAAVTGVKLA